MSSTSSRFYLETAEDVAERLELCARFIPLERLSAVPDCGFFPVPRWLAFAKLKRLVAGTRLARQRLGVARGAAPSAPQRPSGVNGRSAGMPVCSAFADSLRAMA